MLIKDYELEFVRSRCNSNAKGIHCIVHLKVDVSKVIPYLNADLGGDSCSSNPPFVTFKVYGKLITVHSDKIAINALKDQNEAKKVVAWIIEEINRVWKERDKINPTYRVLPKPQPIEILKHLPKTNCGKCGYPTCLVFAVHVAEGGRDVEDCGEVDYKEKAKIKNYLLQYKLI